MRDFHIYILFTFIYFIAGGFHLYQQYKTNKLLEKLLEKTKRGLNN